MTHRNARNDRKTRWLLQPWGERLDSRTLLSVTAVVTSTFDGPGTGGGTLRDAIMLVDSSPGSPDSIVFEIPKTDPGYNPANGTFTIHPQTELPQITSPVVLDGTTEATFLGEPALVVIDGKDIKGPANGLTLARGSDGSTIQDLNIVSFMGAGIRIESATDTIIDNLIGTDPTGTLAGPGNQVGILIDGANGGGAATIGGTATGTRNVISGNNQAGIEISGTTSNLVQGNFIGTDVTGTLALGNTETGVLIDWRVQQHDWRDGDPGRERDLGQRRRLRCRDQRQRHDEQRGAGQLHRHRRHRHTRSWATLAMVCSSTWARPTTRSAG